MEAIEKDIERFLAVVGSGSGYGSGYGDGSGYGYGYSYGYGSGSGYGVKEFNGRKVYDIDSVRTLIYAVKGDVARGAMSRRLFATTLWGTATLMT